MQEIVTQNLARSPEKIEELPHAELEAEALAVMSKNVSKEIDEAILKGSQTSIAKTARQTSIFLSPIGVTKASHEESKKKRKASAKSRKINRKK